jgi:hypothetical protein
MENGLRFWSDAKRRFENDFEGLPSTGGRRSPSSGGGFKGSLFLAFVVAGWQFTDIFMLRPLIPTRSLHPQPQDPPDVVHP